MGVGGVIVSREKNFRERGHTIGRMRPEKNKKQKQGRTGLRKRNETRQAA